MNTTDRGWLDRKPSFTETAIEDETAILVEDFDRDIDEIQAIAEASAISALEAIKT